MEGRRKSRGRMESSSVKEEEEDEREVGSEPYFNFNLGVSYLFTNNV